MTNIVAEFARIPVRAGILANSATGNIMDLDEELCLCFHVTKRKVINFLRVEQPRRVGQLSECFGAGTGCGWGPPYLQRLFYATAAGRGIRTHMTPSARP